MSHATSLALDACWPVGLATASKEKEAPGRETRNGGKRASKRGKKRKDNKDFFLRIFEEVLWEAEVQQLVLLVLRPLLPPPCASVPPPGHVVHRQRARRGRGFNCVCGGCACLLPAVLWPSPQPPCTPSARGMPKEKEAVLRGGGGGGGRGRLCQRRRHQGVVQAVRQRGGIEIVEHVATVVLKISSHFPTVYRYSYIVSLSNFLNVNGFNTNFIMFPKFRLPFSPLSHQHAK